MENKQSAEIQFVKNEILLKEAKPYSIKMSNM